MRFLHPPIPPPLCREDVVMRLYAVLNGCWLGGGNGFFGGVGEVVME